MSVQNIVLNNESRVSSKKLFISAFILIVICSTLLEASSKSTNRQSGTSFVEHSSSKTAASASLVPSRRIRRTTRPGKIIFRDNDEPTRQIKVSYLSRNISTTTDTYLGSKTNDLGDLKTGAVNSLTNTTHGEDLEARRPRRRKKRPAKKSYRRRNILDAIGDAASDAIGSILSGINPAGPSYNPASPLLPDSQPPDNPFAGKNPYGGDNSHEINNRNFIPNNGPPSSPGIESRDYPQFGGNYDYVVSGGHGAGHSLNHYTGDGDYPYYDVLLDVKNVDEDHFNGYKQHHLVTVTHTRFKNVSTVRCSCYS